MVFKNIEYMNGGCFENLSHTSVPKSSIGREPPTLPPGGITKCFSCKREGFRIYISMVVMLPIVVIHRAIKYMYSISNIRYPFLQ
jgi:hypothetical protein